MLDTDLHDFSAISVEAADILDELDTAFDPISFLEDDRDPANTTGA